MKFKVLRFHTAYNYKKIGLRVRPKINLHFQVLRRPHGKTREGRIAGYLTDEQRSHAGDGSTHENVILCRALRTPNTNAENIEVLSGAEQIAKNGSETYIKINRFMNRIVHLHNYINTDTLYDILVNELYDIKEFYVNLFEIIKEYDNEEV